MSDAEGSASSTAPKRVIGRYALYGEIAAGGMATVHYGRLLGPVGFSRTVAIKRLHPQYAKDPEFVSMFLDEARLAARIRHPNTVQTLDVVATKGELFLVMEYVQGESLAKLVRATAMSQGKIPPSIVVGIMSGVLHGLHAAHEAKDERGEGLGLVHRDVSPHNVLVGVDGVARVLDFGVAKAQGRVGTTREGQLKGKISYMAPEQIDGTVDRQSDIFAAGIVLWELLVGRKLFTGENEAKILNRVMQATIPKPSDIAKDVPPAFDAVAMQALERDRTHRFATARDMARALEKCAPMAPPSDIGEWVEGIARDTLKERAQSLAEIESSSARVVAKDESEALVSQLQSDPPPAPARPAEPFEPISAVSSVALATSGRPPPPGRARRNLALPIVALLALFAVGGIALYFARAKSGDDVPAKTPTATTSAREKVEDRTSSAPSSGETVAKPSASASAPEKVPPPPTTTPTMEVAKVTPKTAPKTPVPTATTTAKPTSAPAKTPDPCDPPYTIDAKGAKHYKAACL